MKESITSKASIEAFEKNTWLKTFNIVAMLSGSRYAVYEDYS